MRWFGHLSVFGLQKDRGSNTYCRPHKTRYPNSDFVQHAHSVCVSDVRKLKTVLQISNAENILISFAQQSLIFGRLLAEIQVFNLLLPWKLNCSASYKIFCFRETTDERNLQDHHDTKTNFSYKNS